MNALEKIVYNIVCKSPKVKLFVRNMYQTLFDLFPPQKEFFKGEIQYKENYFFGFHDVNPFSCDGSKVLANASAFDLRMPFKEDGLNLGYFPFRDGKMGDFVKIDTTYAWNFHKGCRLQWLTTHELIYNYSLNKKLVSKILNIDTHKSRIIDFPIDAVNQCAGLATSFSYERLEKCMPGYGYLITDDSYLDDNKPTSTGLFLIDLKKNETKLLLPIRVLYNDLADVDKQNYFHFVTHSAFSTDGQYISVMHRWVEFSSMKRKSRLLIYNLHENKYFYLNTSGMISHYVWNDKHEIIAYCSFEGKNSHVLFNIDEFGTAHRVAYPTINSDGHQSFINSKNFVTDTYPDKYRMSYLKRVDINNNKVINIAKCYSPKQFQGTTKSGNIDCDLHPRVSPDTNYVCFDSPRTGKRGLYIMKLH